MLRWCDCTKRFWKVLNKKVMSIHYSDSWSRCDFVGLRGIDHHCQQSCCEFQRAQIRLCFYHLGQSVRREVEDHCLPYYVELGHVFCISPRSAWRRRRRTGYELFSSWHRRWKSPTFTFTVFLCTLQASGVALVKSHRARSKTWQGHSL